MDTRRALRRLAAASVAVIAVLAVSVGSASADHSWNNYHWKKGAEQLSLNLGENLSADWEPDLAETSTDWSVSTVLDTTIVPGNANPKTCKPTAGMVEVCNAKYGRNGWLGLAQIWLQDGHIFQGVAKMNDTYFTTAKYNTPSQRLHVMCQEVGHTFGLGHTSEDGSSQGTCMDYSNDPGSTKPNAHDYEQLEAIYSHVETSTATSTQTSPGASGWDVDERREWGRLVESHDGHEVYVRHFGNGVTLVTDVTTIW
jgi:hypothetical protein